MSLSSQPTRVCLGACLLLLAAAHSPSVLAGDDLFSSWTPLGPTLVTNGQSHNGSRTSVTGRINAVAVNPHNPLGDIWVGAATGGVWNGSIDPEPSWSPMTDDQATLAVGQLALDSCSPVRCETVWAGTGENSIRRDTQYGLGLLNGRWDGESHSYEWQRLGAETFAGGNIARLLLDPSTPDTAEKVLYVALSSGVTANATHSTLTTKPPQPFGIWKSVDAGATWQLKLAAEHPATDLEMDPTNPKVLYAGIRRVGMFKSEDGGETWNPIHDLVGGGTLPAEMTTGSDWPELAVYRQPGMAEAVLYAVLGPCEHPHKKWQPIGCKPTVYRSKDSAASWQQVYPNAEEDLSINSYVSYTHALTIHPFDPDTLWYGGTRLYKSTDGGKDWSLAGWEDLHPDHHQLLPVLYDFLKPLAFLSANDGGLYIGDGDELWYDSAQKGLAVTQFQSLDATQYASFLLGGTQDNGTLIYEGSEVWNHIDDGDSASTLIDRDDFETLYDIYVGSSPRRCNKVGSCPQSWPHIPGQPGGDILPDTEGDQDPNVSWYPPMIQAQAAPGIEHVLYFGTVDLFWSHNQGKLWHRITPAPPLPPLGGTTTFAELGGAQNPITTIAVELPSHDRLYAGFYDGQLWAFEVADHAWTPIDANLPDRPVNSILLHPADPKTLFVALAGFGEHSVYTTTLGSGAWTPFDDSTDGALAVASTNSLAIEPAHPYRMWAGTDYGVYQKDDGEPWIKTGGLPNVAVYALRVTEDGSSLYAGTHGRGVWARSTHPKIDFYFEDCCGETDLYDPQPLVGFDGWGFEPNQSCELSLFAAGELCGRSSLDADGAAVSTNEHGIVVTTKAGAYGPRAKGLACRGGFCAGGIDPARCAVDRLSLSCGRQVEERRLARPTASLDPASGALTLKTRGRAGRFTLTPTLVPAEGAAIRLCEVSFESREGEDDETVLGRAAAALDADPLCRLAGVFAELERADLGGKSEDDFPSAAALRLTAPNRQGLALVPELSGVGGGGFGLGSLGREGRRVVPRLSVAGSAAGGTMKVTARSPFGLCTKTLATTAGERAEEVATRLARAFAEPERGGFSLEARCPAGQQAFDVLQTGASLSFLWGLELTVESGDPGLTITAGAAR